MTLLDPDLRPSSNVVVAMRALHADTDRIFLLSLLSLVSGRLSLDSSLRRAYSFTLAGNRLMALYSILLTQAWHCTRARAVPTSESLRHRVVRCNRYCCPASLSCDSLLPSIPSVRRAATFARDRSIEARCAALAFYTRTKAPFPHRLRSKRSDQRSSERC